MIAEPTYPRIAALSTLFIALLATACISDITLKHRSTDDFNQFIFVKGSPAAKVGEPYFLSLGIRVAQICNQVNDANVRIDADRLEVHPTVLVNGLTMATGPGCPSTTQVETRVATLVFSTPGLYKLVYQRHPEVASQTDEFLTEINVSEGDRK